MPLGGEGKQPSSCPGRASEWQLPSCLQHHLQMGRGEGAPSTSPPASWVQTWEPPTGGCCWMHNPPTSPVLAESTQRTQNPSPAQATGMSPAESHPRAQGDAQNKGNSVQRHHLGRSPWAQLTSYLPLPASPALERTPEPCPSAQL